VPGQIRHPEPLPAPEGFEPIRKAADLYHYSESAWGGRRLLGTENIGFRVFNAGYPLRDVTLSIRGEDDGGSQIFAVEHTVEELPRGEQVTLEVASYEIPAEPKRLTVTLVSAEFYPVD
jgi:hypothetical protein